MSGMSNAHYPSYPTIPNPYGSDTPYVQKTCAKEEIIFPSQIDTGLRFPYKASLVELCRHFQITLTQLSTNIFRFWTGFKILCYQRGWTYFPLYFFRCFYRL